MIIAYKTKHKVIPSNSNSLVKGLGYKTSKADNRYQAYYRYLQAKRRDSNGIPSIIHIPAHIRSVSEVISEGEVEKPEQTGTARRRRLGHF